MKRTLIGIVTFGNLPFTKLAIRELRATVTQPYELFVVVGKPDDHETRRFLAGQQIEHCWHRENMGFPASLNDIYDRAWRESDFDNLIIMGNDVIPYPRAVDAMIELANESDWEWVCSSQFDSKSLVARYEEAKRFFQGDNLVFTDFEARPWDLHLDAHAAEMVGGRDVIEPNCIKDVRNLCLFKRSVFAKIGYADVNFFPGGYFEDNDYCKRAQLAGVNACGLPRSAYFHFWSRTIHQGDGKSANDFYFGQNSRFYQTKWGGPFGSEAFALPFNGQAYHLPGAAALDATVEIRGRSRETPTINYWRKMRG